LVRLTVLAALGCASLLGLAASIHEDNLRVLVSALVACGLAFVPAILIVRHTNLALLIALSPLPGLLTALCTFSGKDAAVTGLAVVAGLTAAMLTGAAMAGQYIRIEPDDGIARSIARMAVRLMATMLGLYALPALLVLAVDGWSTVPMLGAAAILAIVSACLVQYLAAPLLGFNEDDVARSNRTREWYARLASPLLPAAQRRFGFSVFGIAIVLASIAYFGARQARHSPAIDLWFILAVCALCAAASYAVIRDWRRSFATIGSLALAASVGVWVAARAGVEASQIAEAMWLSAILTGLILQIFAAQEATLQIIVEDDVVAGSERALELRAIPVGVISTFAIIVVLLFLWSDLRLWAVFAVTLIANAITAAVIQPAIAITVENLFPRAATVAARYRIS
jgi:hypothetical protein